LPFTSCGSGVVGPHATSDATIDATIDAASDATVATANLDDTDE
jgi:hypothetical protein